MKIFLSLDGSNWGSVNACMNLLKDPKYFGFSPKSGSIGFKSAVNILVIPVANPDGYQYTFDTDRMWRKNLSPTVRFKKFLKNIST